MTVNRPRKPRNLTGPGLKLWEQINDEHILEPHEAALVEELGRVRSRIAELDKIADEQGLIVKSSQGPKASPALTESRQQRLLFARLVSTLAFPVKEDL